METATETKGQTASAAAQAMPPALTDNGHLAHFLDPVRYRHLQLVSKDFAGSELVPKRYQGKPCDCLIALELAARLGMHPLMVMQNVYTVHGTPGMQGQFVIALVNSSGAFSAPLEWEYEGEGDSRTCTCKAMRRRDGKTVELKMSIAIAKAEGWYAQNPKWKNIPDQMLAYRSASWLARLHCPEVLLGLQTVEEIHDVIDITPLPQEPSADPTGALKAAAKSKNGKTSAAPQPPAPEPAQAAVVTCPQDGAERTVEFCAKCGSREGCPAH